jgi:heme A synthase
MRAAAFSGARDALSRFRALLNVTILAAFALVIVGGVVRVSDSGLGCGSAGSGSHGWPLCDGRVLPFLQGSTLIEFSHRVLATVVTILIAALIWTALRHLRDRRWLVRGSIAAGVLVLAQAALGGATVDNNLAEGLVAAHLGMAMLLLGTLLTIRRIATEPDAAPAPAESSRALRALAVVATLLVLGTIVAGGWIAGTEKQGAEGAGLGQGAHTACGDQFPNCAGDGVLPFGKSRLIDIQLTHRAFMYLAVLALVAFVAVAWRRGYRSRGLALILALLGLQVLLGALNVWLGEHPVLIVAHLTTGTLLWMTTVYTALGLFAVPGLDPAAERTARREEAAAAA